MATLYESYVPAATSDYYSIISTWKSQSFLATSTHVIDSITLRLRRSATDANTVFTVNLCENDSDLPGTVLATFGSFTVQQLSTSYADYNFSSATYEITSGVTYVISIHTTEEITTSTAWWGTSTDNGYANGRRGQGNYTSLWSLLGINYDAGFKIYGPDEEPSYIDISGTINGTSSISGAATTGTRIDPPSQTYWYDGGVEASFYYRLWVQSDGSYGDHPPIGIENVDYEVLAGYLPNFINTNRRLIAATRNSIYYEDI